MPEPNRPPWLIEPALAGVTVARLIKQDAAIGLACHACHHRTRWTAGELRRRFSPWPGVTVRDLAPRLRCSRCKSEWVEIGRDVAAGSPARL